jgi:hypothetical protein
MSIKRKQTEQASNVKAAANDNSNKQRPVRKNRDKAVETVVPESKQRTPRISEEKPVKKVRGSRTEQPTNVNVAEANDLRTLMLTVLTEYTNGTSVADLVARLSAKTPAKTVKIEAGEKPEGKRPRTPKDSKTGPIGLFAKPTRAFGFMLRHEHDTASLKADFKEAIAKYPNSGVVINHFNKVFDDSFIVAGLVKRKGVLTFTGFDANGKKASAPVPESFAK